MSPKRRAVAVNITIGRTPGGKPQDVTKVHAAVSSRSLGHAGGGGGASENSRMAWMALN